MIELRPVSPVSDALMVVLALLIYVIPVPLLGQVRIDYVALLMLYLGTYRELPFPLGFAFGIGLLQDLVSLAPLGQHALGLLLICWLLQFFRDRLKLASPPAQLPLVLMLLLLLKIQYSWMAALNLGILPSLDALASSLVTAVVWIPFVILVRWFEHWRPA